LVIVVDAPKPPAWKSSCATTHPAPANGTRSNIGAETVAIHGGHTSCQARPGGGARFVVTLLVITP
jgi:hypothetical protein